MRTIVPPTSDPCGLRQFSVEVTTPQGLIRVFAECPDEVWMVKLTVPEGSVAKIDLTVLGGEVFDRGAGDWEFALKSLCAVC